MDADRIRLLLDPEGDEDARSQIVYGLRNEASLADHGNLPDWADDPEVLDALVQLAGDAGDPGSFWSLASETLVWLWLAQGTIDRERFGRLLPESKDEVRSYVRLRRPELLADVI